MQQADATRLGEVIKKLRLQREMTQQQLADKCGIDIRYLGAIERGQRNPTFAVMQGIASVLGLKNVRPAAESEAVKVFVGNRVSPGVDVAYLLPILFR